MTKIKYVKYLDEEGSLSKSCTFKISAKDLIKGYEVMSLTRHLDERMIKLQRQGTISFAMSSRGEEACSVATAAALNIKDWIYPQYRELGVMFWRNYSLQDYLHHMFCNEKDPLLGRQMPNHFGSKDLNVVTVSSPLATQIPHAVGCAHAMKLRGEKQISMSMFGDGATSKGDFHTAMNFAAVLKAPTIFFCRNNGYAISTPTEEQFATKTLAIRGPAYGIKTFQVDGNDFIALQAVVSEARKYCLEGKGPVFIEAITYRLFAHSTSDDPSQYRSDQEVQAWEKKCPILRLRRYLEKSSLWDEKKEKILQKRITSDLDQAIKVAKNTDKPPLESIVRDVYFEVPQSLREQLEDIQALSS